MISSSPSAFTSAIIILLVFRRCEAPHALLPDQQPQQQVVVVLEDPVPLLPLPPRVLYKTFCDTTNNQEDPLELFAISFSASGPSSAELDVVVMTAGGKVHYHSGLLDVAMTEASVLRFFPADTYEDFFAIIDDRLMKNNLDTLGSATIRILDHESSTLRVFFDDYGHLTLYNDEATPLPSSGEPRDWLEGCPTI
ncbi:hypothetical protein FOL46_003516 [Perkinsus olseni]|uniref:Uncharacterized protein n=1 Tax=Perkinsus olseni TaxID=32597 RepID=A0A7J6M2L3_PEROL|nr:hypothetical protein FOL46_003516 [Perkinsus olseni]